MQNTMYSKEPAQENKGRLIVIGLDGVTWDLIMPWINENKLPVLKKLMKEGVWGELESTIPPLTAPAWVSFATGNNPGKHGVFDFVLPKKSLNNFSPVTTKDIHGVTFYEMLDDYKKKCILINLPVSYPALIDGIVITSLMTMGNNFIFPPKLKEEISELKDYRLTPDMSLIENKRYEAYIEDIRKLEKNRFEVAKNLYKRNWDFFFILFSGTDWVQHIMYDKLISGENNINAMKIYKEIDEYIGWFLDNATQNTNFLVMSDHGFNSYKKVFRVRKWLSNEGYMKFGTKTISPAPPVHRLAKEAEKVSRPSKYIKFPTFLVKRIELVGWARLIYDKFGIRKIFPVKLKTTFSPDIKESRAYGTSTVKCNFGFVYLNDKQRFVNGKIQINDYEKVREEILIKMKDVKDIKTDGNIVKRAWKKEELYSGDQLVFAPDIIFETNKPYTVTNTFVATEYVGRESILNGHALSGIIIAYGPDITFGSKIDGAKIWDIAPTILHMYGVPLPEGLDGKILRKLFNQD